MKRNGKTLLEIRPMLATDWTTVAAIYQHSLEAGTASLDTEVPTWEEWDKSHLRVGRLVATAHDRVVGWIALTAISTREVYKGVASISVYISHRHQGKSIGKFLMEQLIIESERNGIWTLQSNIFPENQPSIRLHRKLGFRTVGYREKIGCLNGLWRNIVLMERRSKTVGIQQIVLSEQDAN